MRRTLGPALVERILARGLVAEDTDEERLRKSTLTLAVLFIVPVSTVWVVTYLLLDLPLSAAIPFGYQVVAVASLIYFFVTKKYRFFRFSQLLLMLLLPFLLQWSLGGFVASSAVMVWALVSPFGALMFSGARQAVPWFVAYLALTLLSVVIDPSLPTRDIPSGVGTAFFGLNVVAVSSTAYLLLQYFVRQRERAMAALDEKHRALEIEQARSERLLLNILPQPIAERLKNEEGVIADSFTDVTVLFGDIVGFTGYSSGRTPEEVVSLLNEVFSRFDRLAEDRGLEKIKTIGDAYMVVGGLPIPRPDHVEAVVEMAIAMQTEARGARVELRIGIGTGPVVAGVIGTRKFSYDLWGDTVNTASRMESHGLPGEIQVTEPTFLRARDRFPFVLRGEVNVKGKGPMTTYFVDLAETRPAEVRG
jgi:class 3 adenylate cyclase